MNGIEGSKEHFAPDEVEDIINKLRKVETHVKRVTRTDGLRAKVIKLAEKERFEQGREI